MEDSESHRKLGNFPCDMNILEEIKQIASQPNSDNNLLLTAESFSGKFINMDRVQELLRPWNKVVIIAYYRRFYEWFHSQWNQMYKDSNPDIRPHFIDFITCSMYFKIYIIFFKFFMIILLFLQVFLLITDHR